MTDKKAMKATPLKVVDRNTGFGFQRLPEVYQIEVTTACQLACGMCHRDETTARRGGDQHLDVDQLDSWIKRGDLAGSYFVELQMSGEPMLHPDLGSIVRRLKREGLLVGMSTNGLLLEKRIGHLVGLDSITVSIDSSDPAEYARRRPYTRGKADGDLMEVFRNVDALLAAPAALCPPFVDVQVLAPLDWTQERITHETTVLHERFGSDPRVNVRYTLDCQAISSGRQHFDVDRSEVCVNPFMSVSVQADGTVVSCCYVWDRAEQNTYGNLNDESLEAIWAGPKVAAMREAQRCGTAGGWCKTCYLRSPALIHLGFLPTWTRRATKESP